MAVRLNDDKEMVAMIREGLPVRSRQELLQLLEDLGS